MATTQKYWNGTGKHQSVYTALSANIPTSGSSDSLHIELLRSATNLYYEYYNNGNCNAKEEIWESNLVECDYCSGDYEECDHCSGGGEYYDDVLVDIKITPHYDLFLNFIGKVIPSSVIEKVKIAILTGLTEEDEILAYETLMDSVLEYVTVNPDKQVPLSYKL